jgi:putative nucleotidyltransferase with HDIG domain
MREMRDLKAIVKRVDQLPSLPQVAARIMTVVDDPESCAQDLHNIISCDPALSARILKLVNSAYFGLTNKVSDIGHAINLLGFSLVKNVALGVSILDMLGGDARYGQFRIEDFWKHSVSVACLSRGVAPRTGISVESAFGAGLLHDIGKLVLAKFALPEFVATIKVAEDEFVSFQDAEARVLSTGHAELGGWLLQSWALPGEFIGAVQWHHDPLKAPQGEQKLALAVGCSSFVCDRKGLGLHCDVFQRQFAPEVWQALGVSEDEMKHMADSVVADSSFTEIFKKH